MSVAEPTTDPTRDPTRGRTRDPGAGATGTTGAGEPPAGPAPLPVRTLLAGSLGASAWFAATAAVPRATLLGVAAVVVAAVAMTALARDPRTRDLAGLTAVLTLFVSVPVTRVPDNRDLLVALVGATAVVTSVALASRRHGRLPHGTPALLLLVAVLVSATLLLQRDSGVVGLAIVLAALLPAFVLAGSADDEARRAVATVLVGLACLQAALAVAEPWLLPAPLWAPAQRGSLGQAVPLTNEVLGGLERSQASLGHPLPLGLLLVVGLALTVRFHAGSGPLVRFGVPLLLLSGLLAAGARVSLAMAVVVLLLLSGRRLGPARLVTVVAALLAVLVWVLLSGADVGSRVDEVAGSGSWQHRVGALVAVERLLLWQDLAPVLLGNGYGSTSEVMSGGLLQNDGFGAVDNQLVLVLVQGGLAGLALLLALLASALWRGVTELRPALLCLIGTMLVFDVLLWPSAAVVMGTLLGLALARPGPRG